MNPFPPTIVIRHKKENLKKCTLKGLEARSDFLFFRYPLIEIPPYSNYVLLALDASQELSISDHMYGLLILDATWRYAHTMQKNILKDSLKMRRLPRHIQTAYPRRQLDCSDPTSGLASIEAIACAYTLMGRPIQGLLDQYYWKNSFLEKNKSFLLKYAKNKECV